MSTRQILQNWGIVYIGNLIGALATAVFLYLSAQYTFGGGAVGLVALEIARAKTTLAFVQAYVLHTNSLLIKTDSAFLARVSKSAADYTGLTWTNFLLVNLLPEVISKGV